MRVAFRRPWIVVALSVAIWGFVDAAARRAVAEAFQVEEATIEEINQAFEAGTLTSEKLVRQYLLRIAAYDQQGPSLNSIITINPQALATARALDQERQTSGPRSPLHGIPVLLKDNYDTFDMLTTAGSLSLANSIPPDDGFVTQRLREAGAIILGKTNMHEFAAGGSTVSSLGGQTRNPYDTTRIPGGSSGGTGASIAANFAAVGLGTETSGSIKFPSAVNDLVGLKPTLGLISRNGIIPLFLYRDTGGPMTRTVADTALVLDAIAGFDPADPITEASVGQIPDSYTQFLNANALTDARIGVVRQFMDLPGANPEVISLVNAAIGDVVGLGAQLIDPLDVGVQANQYYNSFEYDMNRYLESLGPNAPYHTVREIIASGQYLPELRNGLFIDLAGDVPPQQDPRFNAEIERRDAAKAALLDIMDNNHVDALVHATVNGVPPRIGEIIDYNDLGLSSRDQAAFLGLPSITVPAGFTADGLPVGLTFTGRPFSEPTLIGLAYAYEQATHHRMPPASAPQLEEPNTVVLAPRSVYAVLDNDSDAVFDDLGDSAADALVNLRQTVGEGDAAANNRLVRMVAKFALPEPAELMDLLKSATLRFFVESIEGTPAGPLSLLHSMSDNDLDFLASDYEDASYMDTLLNLVQPTDTAGSYYELDVTDLVLADYASDGANPLSAFRLQVSEANFLEDNLSHRYLLTMPGAETNRPQLVLTFIPEPPASLLAAMALLSVLGCAWRGGMTGRVVRF